MALQFTTRQIKNAATTAKIADDAVTTAKVADNAITNAQLADAAVDTAELAANAVTAAKMDLTGTFDYSGGTVSVAAPTADAHAATKAYVDNAAVAFPEGASARCHHREHTLSGTQTVDGVSLGAGDRLLVKDQSTASANGVYVVAAGAWSRAGDMDAAGDPAAPPRAGARGHDLRRHRVRLHQRRRRDRGHHRDRVCPVCGQRVDRRRRRHGVTGNSVAVDLATNAGLEISGAKLRAKVKANSGIGSERRRSPASRKERRADRRHRRQLAPAPGRQHAGPVRQRVSRSPTVAWAPRSWPIWQSPLPSWAATRWRPRRSTGWP